MLQIIKGCSILISTSIPLEVNLSIKDIGNPQVMKEYISPTLNQPIENLSEKQTKELLEHIFINEIKDAK